MSRLRWGIVAAVLAAAPLGALAGDTAAEDASTFKIQSGSFTLNTHFLIQVKESWIKDKFEYSGDLYDYLGGVNDTKIDPRPDYDVRRARIILSGDALFPWLHYEFAPEFAGGTNAAKRVEIKDAWLAVTLSDWNNWQFGQFKAPFDIFELFPESHRMFVENPLGSEQSAPGYDQGVMWHGHNADNCLHVRAALQNGNGAGQAGNDNDKFLATVRLSFENKGGFANTATAAARPDALQWQAGLGYLSNPVNQPGPQPRDESTQAGCDPGVSSKCRYATDNRRALELFGAVRGQRFQVNGTVQQWKLDNFFLGESESDGFVFGDVDATYWNFDAGFFVAPRWEIAGRFGRWKTDGDRIPFVGGSKELSDRLQDWRVGTNYYFAGHNLKLMVDYGADSDRLDTDIRDIVAGKLNGTSEATADGFRIMLSAYR